MLERMDERLERVEYRTRAIFYGLGDLLDFTKAKNYIEDVMIRDELDSQIFSLVFSAGEGGIYPKDIAKELHHFRTNRWRVTKRIQRMNQTLRQETGRTAFRKVGWRWAVTRFIQKTWGLPEEEVKEEGALEET